MGDETRRTAGVVAPPPLLYAGGLALGFLAQAVLPAPRLPRRAARGAGALLVGGGVVPIGWFVQTLRGAGTSHQPWRPTTRLVTNGPYRFSRNPGYLGMASVSAGVGFLAGAFWAVALLPVTLLVIRRGVIEREERYLDGLFGEEYARYRARVRRWL